ncbi:SCP-like protein [Ancylostoma caninum]|uniref:SCP-like protein n=1 Tax=Ancylostoma caninum TaxID=29170 RepID=A0A368GCA5_ANCCA|nr:SCP-like protein [Ancylostoma caninum]
MRSTIARGRYVARGITKPPATDMRKLYWSCALENSAQEVANRCIFAHSNRNGKNTGENLYQYRIRKRWFPNPVPIGGTGIDASRAWEAEFNNIGWPSNRLTRSSFNTGIGHATQMAWWQTSMIGCGVAQCSDNTYQKILLKINLGRISGFPALISNTYKFILTSVSTICSLMANFSGNWIDDNIYDSGATCSDCGSGYRCDTYSGLCGV